MSKEQLSVGNNIKALATSPQRIGRLSTMSEAITFIALAIWVVCTEIRIRQLYFRNEFLMKRVVDVDARMCVMESQAEEAK